MKTIAFFPAFENINDFVDHYYRALWYLSPLSEKISKVSMPRTFATDEVGPPPAYLDPDLAQHKSSLAIETPQIASAEETKQLALDADIILVWSADARTQLATPASSPAVKTILIDHEKIRYAGSFYLKIAEEFESLHDDAVRVSARRFKDIAQTCKSERGYIFGTGPQLAQAEDFDFSNGVSIACNSMVRNKRLLDRLRPPLIVVADPIFHAGPSSYAASFRADLISAMDRYGSDLIVPIRDFHIYQHYLPEHLRERVCAVPYLAGEEPNLDLTAEFHVTSTANVLTLFLLPLATTFFDKIHIAGCDGRPLEDNSYFWSHDKASQVVEHMEPIREAHPAFFDIDYDDYYTTHCKTLASWITAAEEAGKNVINLTPSYIPALKERTVTEFPHTDREQTELNEDKDTALVLIDPDGKDSSGHFLAYDRQLIRAAEAKNQKFVLFARKDIDTELLPKNISVIRCLTVHSWSIGLRNDGQEAYETKKFADELRQGLRTLREQHHGDIRLYLYCGSLEHTGAVEAAIEGFDNVSAHVTLFWHSYATYQSPRYVNRWRPKTTSFAANPNLTISVPTQPLADGLLTKFALNTEVAPHPSTTFADNEAQLEASVRQLSTEPIVLFPGGVRKEKGFHLTVDTANALGREQGMRAVVRTNHANADPETREAVVRLDRQHVDVSSEHLDEDAFKAFLSQASVIVCPYAPSHFAHRTSGLVIDAMILGIPVVALKETWLGDVVENGGFGLAAEPSAEDIQSKVKKILHSYDDYAQAALKAREQYCKVHSWSALIDFVMDGRPREPLPTQVPESFETQRTQLIEQLPRYIRSPIFMPTDKVEPSTQLEGLRAIKDLYADDLEASRKRLRALKKRRRRDRCFIIGNGPSLKETDLSKLRDEVTFATNGFFLKLPDLDWQPTFYVVEDHLVAEDRAHEINHLRGFTKIFPASLRYILHDDPDTIFLDHRPRISYPDGFDFSFDADVNTYAGGTVTFTCMQLAAYFGFKEIYLIGVDASYSIPKDATLSGGGRVKELDMKSDDPNHFNPDYFGKGKRWHEPNVHVMIEAYKEANDKTRARGVEIINATKGGALEVFPRTDYDALFDGLQREPRVLIFDMTRIGDGSATGELKKTLFATWPEESFLQVYSRRADQLFVFHEDEDRAVNVSGLGAIIDRFNPDVILYRPTPRTPKLHRAAMSTIERLKKPLVTWIMDDWPDDLRQSEERWCQLLIRDWEKLLQKSHSRLSISRQMSQAFERRYKLPFIPIANGIEPSEWREPQPKSDGGPLLVRYAGSLADNMTLDSVLLIAEAVDQCARNGIDIKFEIKTRTIWHNRTKHLFAQCKQTSFVVADLPWEEYRDWLQEADVLTIGYNFDPTSVQYVKYSLANKLPECLASGAVVLAVGPSTVATIDTLETLGCGVCITSPDVERVVTSLSELASSAEVRKTYAEKCRAAALAHFKIEDQRSRLKNVMIQATQPTQSTDEGISRTKKASVDETKVVAYLLSDRRGRDNIMVDVGAHFGTSASYFRDLDWTIHCFEPDPANRQKLTARYGNVPSVTIDPRGVSDKPATGVSFFTSDESTGISGLSAFRDTHQETAKVDLTTVSEIVRERGLTRIDFLKIDVEGFDLSVLKGVPWESLAPDVVECEFEDAKTIPLGHRWTDIAWYLKSRGYAVYVSEWHPIARYGIAHDWRRVVPFDGATINEDAWGNLLAFRVDPGIAKVKAAFTACTTFRTTQKPTQKPAAAAAKPVPSQTKPSDAPVLPRPFYFSLGETLRRVSPGLFSLARFGFRSLKHIWTRRILAIPLLVAAIAVALLPAHPSFPLSSAVFLPILVGALAVIILGYGIFRLYHFIGQLASVSEQLSRRISEVQSRTSNDRKTLKSTIDAQDVSVRQLKQQLTAMTDQLRSAQSETSQLISELKDNSMSLEVYFEERLDRSSTLLEEMATNSAKTQQQGLQKIAKDQVAQLALLEKKFQEQFSKIVEKQDKVSEVVERHDKISETIKTQLGELEAATNDIDRANKEAMSTANAELVSTNQKISTIGDGLEKVGEELGKVGEDLEKVRAETNALSRKPTPPHNSPFYQFFNRQLTEQDIRQFDDEWKKRLSQNVSRQRLGYLASRIVQLEQQIHGRIAAPIEDIILRILVTASTRRPNVSVLEIGTLFGGGAAALYDALAPTFDGVHMTLIDPLDGYYNSANTDVLTGLPVNEQILRDNLSRVGVPEGDFTLIKEMSTEQSAIDAASKNEYDVLIIDGDHSYAGVKADFDNYATMVRRGGFVIIDDYGSDDWPEVTQFVDDEARHRENLALVGTAWRTAVFRITSK